MPLSKGHHNVYQMIRIQIPTEMQPVGHSGELKALQKDHTCVIVQNFYHR